MLSTLCETCFKTLLLFLMVCIFNLESSVACADQNNKNPYVDKPAENTIRIATFNVSLYRKKLGQLSRDLQGGSQQADSLAKIIRVVNPDILLLNEIDSDQESDDTSNADDQESGKSAFLFRSNYLEETADESFKPWPYIYCPKVNTGVDSNLDLDNNGRLHTPSDCWGYGEYPGQYGMAVLSRFPIKNQEIRTFQKFLWRDMPHALIPKNVDGTKYWTDEIWNQLRLSSKTHADVAIDVAGTTLHLLISHPTPPVFDGPEDRNGCRNNDEIRFWKDYVEWSSMTPEQTSYHVDDLGSKGALAKDASFAVLGDLNADPVDGSGIRDGIVGLIQSSRVNSQITPRSEGAVEAAKIGGKQNATHKGDAASDTGDFNDGNPGNLRCDFVLPSSSLTVKASGVFWPTTDSLPLEDKKLLDATDHRMVWVDIEIPTK